MRVLFAIAHLGKGGGVALQAFQLYRNLRRLIDIRLVCLDARGPHRALTQEPGVSVAGTLGFPTGILSLRKALRSSRRDFDLFHILDPFYASPAAYLARVTPRVVSLGTDPGREIADRFRHYRPRVIPNGLDRTKFEHLPTREDARKRLGLPPERTILSYVGKVIPEKRVEWLLEIARHLPNVEAVIVGGYSEEYYGDRYYRSLLSKYADIRERTRFVGEVSWDLVPSYLAASDVFVYPSPWEGSPNAVMEAMAAGLPVVVSDIPAHREIVEHGKTGFIARDPQSMTRFADTLERDPGLREEIGSRARALVFERFSMEACAQAHLEFYRSILAS